MKSKLCRTALAVGPVLLLAFAGPSRATSTDVVLNLEGNPTCSSLGDNSAILDYRDGSPATRSIILPTSDGGTQTLEYTLGTDVDGNAELSQWAITSFNATAGNPINYIILKAQGGSGARVFHYGAAGPGDGAIADSEMSSTGARLAAISFCYGLTSGLPTPPVSESPIPDCSDFTDPMTGEIIIDGTVIGRCPTDPAETRLLISLDLEKPFFDVQSCTCNLPGGLPTCDPELAVDEPGACISTDPNDPMQGINERVPIIIQGVEAPNSYVCYTIGGKRTCYGEF